MPNQDHPCAGCEIDLANRIRCPLVRKEIYLCQCRRIQQTSVPAVFDLIANILNRKEIR